MVLRSGISLFAGLPGKWKAGMSSRILVMGALITSVAMVAGCDHEVRKTKYFASAQKYETEGKFPEAAIQYRNALQVDPNFAEARLGFAKLLLRQGDPIGCEAELGKVVATAPQNLEARVVLGQIYLLAGQADRSKEQAEAALTAHPGNSEARLLLGQALLLSKNAEEAEKIFRDVLGPDGKSVQAWIGLSVCRLVQHDSTGAEKALREALAATGRSANVLLLLAAYLEQQKRTWEARQVFEEAQQRDPSNAAVLVASASFYLRTAEPALAEATLIRLREVSKPNTPQRTLLAEYYLATGNKAKAVEELQALVQKDGPAGLAGEKLGNSLLDDNRLSDAEALIQQIRSKDRKSALAGYLEGRVKLMQSDARTALQSFQEALHYTPNAPPIYHYEGLAYLAQNNEQQARGSFTQALQLNPRYGLPRLERARLELKDRNAKAALEDAVVLVRVWPVAATWQVYVDALVQAGEVERARKVLELLISGRTSGPVRAAFRTQAALVDLTQKEFSRARARLKQAHADDPTSVLPEQLIATSYLMQDQIQQAERALATARTQYPNSDELRLLLGNVYLRQRKFAAAEALYDDLLRAHADRAMARLGLAETAAAQGNWRRAAEEFERVGRERQSAAALVRAAQSRERAGDTDLARQTYEAALRLDPKDVVALNNLSWIYINKGMNVDVALRYAELAKELMSDSPEICDTLAWAYYHKNRYRFAVELLERAIRQRPSRGVYYYHLGKCYLGLQDRARAKEAFEKAMYTSGDFPRDEVARELRDLESVQ